jgi:Icc-related predicted phosphoesterase
MIITFISDTHCKHNQIAQYLTGGDLIVHTGDFCSVGYKHEVEDFCKWFSKLNNYTNKIFIAGNHDGLFEKDLETALNIVYKYNNIIYLQDTFIVIDGIKIYGSPWQPHFMDWAFNLPRGGSELEEKWAKIPENTDILLTHTPPSHILDTNKDYYNIGCERLRERIKVVQPKIHAFGHIHTNRGYIDKVWDSGNITHFINSVIMNDINITNYKPFTIDWNKETNEIIFLSY